MMIIFYFVSICRSCESNSFKLQILVVDNLGKKIISTCLKMKDMLDNGITLIEVKI